MQQTPPASLNDYEIIGTLGRGAYGEVQLAKRKSDNLEVAIKILDKKFLAREKKQYQILIEKEVLQRINHPGILKLHSFFQSNDKIYFVIEFCNGGDLSNFIKLNKSFSLKAAQFYVAQIVCQIEALHKEGIAHRDIKPENILLTKEGHLKMIDYGTANFFSTDKLDLETLKRINELREIARKDDRFDEYESEENKLEDYQERHKATFVGTAEYVSPELLEDDICGPEADLWALGCIVYKMFTGKTPFQDNTEYLVFQRIKQGSINIPDNVPSEGLALICRLLLRDPSLRLGAGKQGSDNSLAELKKHQFFKGINFETLWDQSPPKDVIFVDVKKQQSQDSDDDFTYNSNSSNSRQSSNNQKPQIVMSGLVDKKVGFLIYKCRQLVLNDCEKPNLSYFDPSSNQKKGQIDLNDKIVIELEDNGFIIEVPGKKKYYFRQVEQKAYTWVTTIKKLLDSKGIKIKITT